MKSPNPGYTWLANRGIKQETAVEFGLTYCDRSLITDPILPPDFLKFLEVYFTDSLLIPIFTSYGKPFSLYSRYLNNPNNKNVCSRGFKKHGVLYGINKSYSEILKYKKCFVVEGPFDFYMMWQNGIRNVVCLLGTHMTWYQIGILRRFTKNCVLALDPDRAGREATKKLQENLKMYEISSSTFDLKGLDPDDYILKYGPDVFQKINEPFSLSLQTASRGQ